MINLIGPLTDKAESMQEKMGNTSREMEIFRNKPKKMLKNNNTAPSIKTTFNFLGLLIDWALLRKESLSLRIFQ